MSNLKILAALAVAIAALAARPVFGNTLLVLTESSSTVLTPTTTGGAAFGSASLVSPGLWAWILPADRLPVAFEITHTFLSWLEPESTGSPVLVNFANFPPPFTTPPNGLAVFSDFDTTGHGFPTPAANGATLPGAVEFFYQDGSTETFDVQFVDKEDVARVSDTGTTCSLIGLSLTCLTFLRRKFC